MRWWKRLFGNSTAPEQPPQPAPTAHIDLPKDAETYAALLNTALAAETSAARGKINAAFSDLPEKATGLDFGVHVDQDGEGRFTVMMHAGGPDLYVLNKAIDAHRKVFDSTHGSPDGLPLFDPFDTDFDVADTITAVVEQWLADFWPETVSGLPVCVFQADDFASRPAKWLQGGPGK